MLFAGDVAMSGVAPFNLMGSVRGALRAVDGMRRLGARTIVCGHGPVTGPGGPRRDGGVPGVDPGVGRGRRGPGAEPAAGSPGRRSRRVRSPDRPRTGGGKPAPGLRRARGGELSRPLDVVKIFGEMIEYNGGALPQCLA